MKIKTFSSDIYEKNLFVNFYITLSKNNTFITITDTSYKVINSVSTGVVGFKSSKKKSTSAAQAVLDKIISNTKFKAGRNLIMAIYIRGENTNRDLLLKSLSKHNVILNCMVDITGIAYNGCRSPKKRRI